ncbi:MAG: hypothetical protein MJY99_07900 [Fibrobacter sp.]|uniref:hypothetical protein n=1 Tax=Fibrobacter sp. TaxID=35828 RepID=UPI00388FBDCB|nr:hypothetical protein [Fibrobacter sp.]
MYRKYSKPRENNKTVKLDVPEKSPWESGFNVFKRRIGEQLQLNGFSDGVLDDDDLLPFYRKGESETFVLSALGCSVGM